jgi:hypothetical protein
VEPSNDTATGSSNTKLLRSEFTPFPFVEQEKLTCLFTNGPV